MNITALRTFLAIVETGSLVRASERLNVTQSTVTSRLQGLEADLGKTLLYRQKSGVSLTSYGFRFRRYAEAMTDLWQQALQETAYQEGIEAVCDMASHPDLWPTLGRRVLAEVQRDHPATVFSIWPGNPAQLEQWLGTGLIEAALSYRIATGENQTSHPLSDEQLLLYSTDATVTGAPGPGYIHVDAGGDFRRRYNRRLCRCGLRQSEFRLRGLGPRVSPGTGRLRLPAHRAGRPPLRRGQTPRGAGRPHLHPRPLPSSPTTPPPPTGPGSRSWWSGWLGRESRHPPVTLKGASC